ncbi:hypothetical protein, partial [Treponema zioleckii]|uniref:hypothetical protein n=1 Tax=Treponema zioleckii TaxID=331680 RepID=UPI0018D76BD2
RYTDPDGNADIIDGDYQSGFTTFDRQTGLIIEAPALNYVEHNLQNYFITGNENYRNKLPDINCSPLAMSALEAEICEHYGIESESIVPGLSSKAMVGILTGGSLDIAGAAQKVSGSVVGKVGNALVNAKRIYAPSPKHDPSLKWGSENPIPDAKTGQKLLDSAYSSSNHKQLYNIYNGKLIKFQPDNLGGWHPYAVKGGEVPADVLRAMRDNGDITKSQYNKFLHNN